MTPTPRRWMLVRVWLVCCLAVLAACPSGSNGDDVVPYAERPIDEVDAPRITEPQFLLEVRLLQVPEAVTWNENLDYVVELSNPTDDPIPLQPCPAFRQAFGESSSVIAEIGLLNCEEAPEEIAQRESVRFEMRFKIPRGSLGSAGTFEGSISWRLGATSQSYTPEGETIRRGAPAADSREISVSED